MRIIRPRFRLLLLPLVALLAVAGVTGAGASPPASTAGQVHFQATLDETLVSEGPCPPPSTFICVNVTGSGHATGLGAVTESFLVTVDPAGASSLAPSCNIESRTSTLTAANGDHITLQGPGLGGPGCDSPAGLGASVDFWTVTGGTGRFKNVTGNGTDSVSINEVPTVTSVTTFSGTLTR